MTDADEVSDADVAAVARRLEEAAYAVLAMYNLAIGAQEDRGRAEWYMVAIQALARSTFKGVDACRERLTGGCIGNFAGEFGDFSGQEPQTEGGDHAVGS